jgi:hypothetical protein
MYREGLNSTIIGSSPQHGITEGARAKRARRSPESFHLILKFLKRNLEESSRLNTNSKSLKKWKHVPDLAKLASFCVKKGFIPRT